MAKVGLWLRGARGKYAGGVLQKGVGGGTIVRENVTPSNPQTDSQIGQRMKLAPANTFWRQFSYALNNGFENVQYGYKSRWQFMKYALRLDSFALDKGSLEAVALPVRISNGTLGTWDEEFISVSDTTESPTKPSSDVEIVSRVELSSSDIESLRAYGTARQAAEMVARRIFGLSSVNPAQVSFLVVHRSVTGLVATHPSTYRMILSTNHDNDYQEDDFATIVDSWEEIGVPAGEGEPKNRIIPFSEEVEGVMGGLLGLGIIVSEFTDNEWKRSTSTMVVDSAYWESMTSEAAVERARKSYQKKYSATSSWYLNGGDVE